MSLLISGRGRQGRLPEGYRWGRHDHGSGWAGYFIIRASDGASCFARMSMDLDPDGAPEAGAVDAAIAGEGAP